MRFLFTFNRRPPPAPQGVFRGAEIQQIYPISLASGAATHVAEWPSTFTAGNGALWVVAYNRRERPARLARVAPNGRQTTSLRVGKTLSLSAVAAGGGATWVAVSAAG